MFHHLAFPVDPPYILADELDQHDRVAGAVAVGAEVRVVACHGVGAVEQSENCL